MCLSKKGSGFGYGHILGWVVCVLTVGVATGRAQFYIPESVGIRGGLSAKGDQTGQFTQAEAFGDWNLPWTLESDSGWFLRTKLNLSLGWLSGHGITAATASVGPAVAFGHRRFPLSLEGGFSPTFISRYHFGSVNLGQELQFTSYVGVNVDLTKHWRLGYRFQHMSNAGLSPHNPGLNLNMFALSYVF